MWRFIYHLMARRRSVVISEIGFPYVNAFHRSISRVVVVSGRFAHTSQQLVFSEFGKPTDVLQERTVELPDHLDEGQLRVRWLAATLNPSDIGQLQGAYPINTKLPAVGGNEGVAVVEQVGSSSSSSGLSVGDWVMPTARNVGTWQTQAIVNEQQVSRVDNTLPLTTAAQLLINPPTAYRLLHDFVPLQPGDVVLQNGASTAVAKYVIQMCALRGIRTINIARRRKQPAAWQSLVDELTALGADVVVADDQFIKNQRAITAKIGRPKLALDCVTGRITMAMCMALQPNSKLINYGALGMSSVLLPPAASIFNNISVHGFWLSGTLNGTQMMADSDTDTTTMTDWIVSQLHSGRLRPAPVEQVPFADWQRALQLATTTTGDKPMLIM